MNHYTLLGVDKDATEKQIKAAYIQKTKDYHVDKHQNDPDKKYDAEFFTRMIREAYETLIDPNKRKEYDKLSDEKKSKDYEEIFKKHKKDIEQRTGKKYSPPPATKYPINNPTKKSISPQGQSAPAQNQIKIARTLNSDQVAEKIIEDEQKKYNKRKEDARKDKIEKDRQEQEENMKRLDEERRQEAIKRANLASQLKKREEDSLKASEERKTHLAERAAKIEKEKLRIKNDCGLDKLISLIANARNLSKQEVDNQRENEFKNLKDNIEIFCEQLAQIYVDEEMEEIPQEIKVLLGDIHERGARLKSTYENQPLDLEETLNPNSLQAENQAIKCKSKYCGNELIKLIDNSPETLPEFDQVRAAIINAYKKNRYALKVCTGEYQEGQGTSPHYSYWWSFFYPQTIQPQYTEEQQRRKRIIGKVIKEFIQAQLIKIPGLIYEEIPGDGHCLFNAVSLYVNQDQADLRMMVANHIEHNINQFQEFIPLREGEALQEYIQKIREGKEWASHVEIEILMRVLNRPIIIIGTESNIINNDILDRNLQGEPIFVFYNGHNHYDAFLREEGTTNQSIIDYLNNLNRQHHNSP